MTPRAALSEVVPVEHTGAGFLTDPAIEFDRARPGYVRLQEDLIWQRADRTLIVVPAGYSFDGASIPRSVWGLVDHPLSDWLVRGAGVHDWLCGRRDPMGSAKVHAEFYACIRFDARTRMQRWVKARACYAAVRLFGPRFPERSA